jgi:hypothetical protein
MIEHKRMDPLTGLYIAGLALVSGVVLLLVCVISSTYNFCWFTTLPCRGVYMCCGSMKYSDDDEGVCLCDGKCIL